MAGTPLRQMGLLFARHSDSQRSDAELLHGYVTQRDETAFAVLVRRYGRFVQAVCRRMLHQHADAEDATQAVFVVLMRRADSIRHPEIAGWLHGVAVRVCLAQRKSAGRHRLTSLVDEPMISDASAEDRELAAILDEELTTLPTKYRSAIIECDVLERSRSDAAQVLGWPEGTVATRLAKARQLLADKLRQRGVTLSVTALSLGLGSRTSAMPKAWDVPTASALHLAEGVLRTMSYSTLIWRSVAVLLMLGVGGSAMMLAPAGDSPLSVSDGAVSANLAPVPALRPMVWTEREPIVLMGWLAGSLDFSANGEKLLVGGTEGYHAMFDAKTGETLNKPKRGSKFAAVAFAHTGGDYIIGGQKEITYVKVPTASPEAATTTRWSLKHIPALDITPYNIGICPVSITESSDIGNNGEGAIVRRFVFNNAHDYYVMKFTNVLNPDGSITTKPGSTSGIGLNTSGVEDFDEYAMPFAVDPKGERVICNRSYDPKVGYSLLCVMPADIRGKSVVFEDYNATFVCAAWSRDGSTIVTGDDAGIVIVWDAKTFKETERFYFLRDRICAVDVTADGKRIAACIRKNKSAYGYQGAANDPEGVYVWDMANPPKTLQPIALHKPNSKPFHGVANVKFTPDGKTLAACFCNFDQLKSKEKVEGQVRIWDLMPAK